MRSLSRAGAVALVAAIAVGVVGAAQAGSKVPNGDFEKGSFAGWDTSTNGSPGTFVYSDEDYENPLGAGETLGNAILDGFLREPRGTYSAAIVQTGEGDRTISRTFKLPKKARSVSLWISWFNDAEYWTFTGKFDAFVDADNQFFSVDLVKKKADPRTTKKKDVLATLYRPKEGTTGVESDWRKVSAKVRKYAGKKVQLRIAEVDNQSYNVVAVDDLKIRVKKGKK